MQVFDPSNPPLGIAANILYEILAKSPRRVSFAGQAGAGKTEMCQVIAGTSELLDTTFVSHPRVPIFNHADLIKASVFYWIAQAKTRALIPGDEATFDDFVLRSLGITPANARHGGMWEEIISPLWKAMSKLLEDSYDLLPNLAAWAEYGEDQNIEAKVMFVDNFKSLFRTSLQQYGQAIKDLGGDPSYWVSKTIERAMPYRLCLNGDTRFPAEIQDLEGAGWTTVYLDITRETQQQRRPDLTDEQLAHISENGITAKDCHYVVDANPPLNKVVTNVIEILRPK